jgi:ATP-dependent helicase HrpA
VREALPGEVAKRVGAGARNVVTAAEIAARLDTLTADSLSVSVADMRAHLARLVFPGFLQARGDVTRPLTGLERRLDRLREQLANDRRGTATVQALEREVAAAGPAAAMELEESMEELRISLFAQSLGTRFPVSEQRIRRRLADLR